MLVLKRYPCLTQSNSFQVGDKIRMQAIKFLCFSPIFGGSFSIKCHPIWTRLKIGRVIRLLKASNFLAIHFDLNFFRIILFRSGLLAAAFAVHYIFGNFLGRLSSYPLKVCVERLHQSFCQFDLYCLGLISKLTSKTPSHELNCSSLHYSWLTHQILLDFLQEKFLKFSPVLHPIENKN